MIKIGVNLDNWRHADKPVDYCLEYVAKQGIKYVEVGMINGAEYLTGLGFCPMISLDSDPLELRDKLQRLGLEMSQIDVSFPINRWECIDFIRKGIMFASRVGIPCVDATDGAAKLPGISDSEQLGIIKYHLSQCVPLAESHNVIINVEPHGPFTTNAEMLLEIVEHFDSPHVGINFDTGNSFIAGNDPVAFLEQVCKHVTHVHCKDVSEELVAAARGKDTGISASSVFVGQGANADNITACIRLLESRDWDGVLCIEADGEQNVTASIEWLRRQISA